MLGMALSSSMRAMGVIRIFTCGTDAGRQFSQQSYSRCPFLSGNTQPVLLPLDRHFLELPPDTPGAAISS